MVSKLQRRSVLVQAECAALLSLPYRLADLDRTSFIAREGDRVTHCAVLLSGFAYCHKMTGDGARQIVSIHVRGDLLDLQSYAAGLAAYNVQPLSSVQAAFIPRTALLEVAKAFPGIARALWEDAGANASILAEWLLNVGRRAARSRICHLLCELAVRQEQAGICSGPDYDWPMTQEQLGDATGLTSVHVNRTMQGLRKDGLLETIGRRVRVLDWVRVKDEGDFAAGYLGLTALPERRALGTEA
jgi:CRP-like cAMP-binding protein